MLASLIVNAFKRALLATEKYLRFCKLGMNHFKPEATSRPRKNAISERLSVR